MKKILSLAMILSLIIAFATVTLAIDTDYIVKGKITTENAGIPTTITLAKDGETVYTYTIPAENTDVAVTQSFEISGVANGTYDLTVKKDGHLSYTLEDVLVKDGNVDLTVNADLLISDMQLCAGDVNNDGCIDIKDVALLTSDNTYNLSYDQAETKTADVNGDRLFDIKDLVIITSDYNYNKAPVNIVYTPHSCRNVCNVCSLCTSADCIDVACKNKCSGHNEDIYEFENDDYITTESVDIECGKIEYNIEPNIYVRGDLDKLTEVYVPIIEEVSGLSFDYHGHAMHYSGDEKTHVTVTREGMYADYDWYMGLPTNEYGSAYAGSFSHATLTPGYFMFTSSAIIHELSHTIMWRQSYWSYSQLLNEGISTYTTYKAALELEKNHPDVILAYERISQHFTDYEIYDYSKLYEYPIEYWFDNTFEYSGNVNYSIGFRFMWYLDEVYGNYTDWIKVFESTYPFNVINPMSDMAETSVQIEILKKTYGDDVLDNFYPWLKANEDVFVPHYDQNRIDLSDVDSLDLYAEFNAVVAEAKLVNFEYEDLYINLEMLKKQVGEYKELDTSDLTLELSNSATVKLYKADHSSVEMTGTSFDLDEISYIKLVGNGTLDWLEVKGFYDMPTDEQ